MGITTGILIFEDAEELDFVGPWEVFTAAALLNQGNRVVTIAEALQPISAAGKRSSTGRLAATGPTDAAQPTAVRCAKGMRVIPDHTLADAPPLDVVLVPGGIGTRAAVDNPALIGWLRDVGRRCTWVTSVCTGALLLCEAGFARGKRVTTHWSFVETLRARPDITVLDNVRYVQDGNLVTAAGVSAGIDMALWLVGQLHGVDCARNVQRWIEYYPEPPYA